jgi:hypothetical protein
MGGHTANFNRGEPTGDFGICTNAGTFVWKGGRIALGTGPIGTGSFQNTGNFEIDGSAGQLRQLDGRLYNDSVVKQRGPFELNGVAVNRDIWTIERSVGISANTSTAILSNDVAAVFAIELTQPGSVNIDARFYNADGYGSLIVNYTPTSVVLTAFQLSPTPPATAPANLRPPTFSFDGTLGLTLTGSPGRDYILQTSTNLFNWSSVETNNASFNGLLDFEVAPTSDPQRFFRALAQ